MFLADAVVEALRAFADPGTAPIGARDTGEALDAVIETTKAALADASKTPQPVPPPPVVLTALRRLGSCTTRRHQAHPRQGGQRLSRRVQRRPRRDQAARVRGGRGEETRGGRNARRPNGRTARPAASRRQRPPPRRSWTGSISPPPANDPDPRERGALEALLGGGAQLSCVDADTTSPTVAISSDAGAPVTGPFSITVAFSEPVTGLELEDLVVGNDSASELQGNNASYMATITPAASGTVTVDNRDRGRAGRGRQPERGGGAVLDRRGPDAGAGSAGDRCARACAAVAGRRRSPTDGELTAARRRRKPRLRPVRRHGGGDRPRRGRPPAVLAPVPRPAGAST